MGLLDDYRNKLKGLLGDMPLTQMAQGRAEVSANGLLNAMRAIKPFQGISPGEFDAALNALNPMMLGKIVYHGSPHKFDKFDASKIGTGEGAQAYGHGVYLADSPKVAMEYQKLHPITDPTDTGFIQARAAWAESKGKPQAALSYLDKQEKIVRDASGFLTDGGASSLADIAKARELISGGKMQPGSLYKADLPDEWIPKMLDWDKPLSEQPELQALVNKVHAERAAADAKKGYRALSPSDIRADNQGLPVGKDTGAAAMMFLQSARYGAGPEDAARLLRKAGIPGIRYLDGGSRGKGQGSYNYVVFPGLEDQVKILERNGEPVNAIAEALMRRRSP